MKKTIIIFLFVVLLLAADAVGVYYYSRYIVGFEKAYVASHQISQRTRISKDDLIEV